jgi:ribosomal protein L17
MIFGSFVHSGILLLWSIWWNLKRRGSVRRRLQRINMWRRMLLRSLFCWLILKRRGSVRRFQRMKMWRRMLLRSLFRWLILKRRG